MAQQERLGAFRGGAVLQLSNADFSRCDQGEGRGDFGWGVAKVLVRASALRACDLR